MDYTDRRVLEEFEILATIVCRDGVVEDDEIGMIRSWLTRHGDDCCLWPLDAAAELLMAILKDGIVTPVERKELFLFMREFSASHDTPSAAIFDDDAELVIPGRSFVITGEMSFSTREAFQGRLLALDAIIQPRVTKATDCLVVGMTGSEAWIRNGYGTKIERAMNIQRSQKATEKGTLKIVRDWMALEAVVDAEEALARPGSVPFLDDTTKARLTEIEQLRLAGVLTGAEALRARARVLRPQA